MQQQIAEEGIIEYHFVCNICPGCSCDRTIRKVGNRHPPKIRQICSEFPHMDGHTNWQKVK